MTIRKKVTSREATFFDTYSLLLYRKLRRISYKVTKALREDRTAAERNLSLRDPPQAENPALQDSIFISDYEAAAV